MQKKASVVGLTLKGGVRHQMTGWVLSTRLCGRMLNILFSMQEHCLREYIPYCLPSEERRIRIGEVEGKPMGWLQQRGEGQQQVAT